MSGPNLIESIALKERDRIIERIERHRDHLRKVPEGSARAETIRRAIAMQADMLAVIRHHSGVGLIAPQYLRMTNKTAEL